MKISLVRITNHEGIKCYAPLDAEATTALESSPDVIMVDYKKKRNAGNHRRYFAFIKASFDMQDEYDCPSIWRKYIQMKAGFFDEVVTAKGVVMYWPQSISWEDLDENEFKKLFDDVVNAFLKYYGHPLSESQIDKICSF